MQPKITVALVGHGRFGKLLCRLLGPYCDITIVHKNDVQLPPSDVVIYAVPIHLFEAVIKAHAPQLTNRLVIDVLSVKTFPQTILHTYLHPSTRILLTHPLFGPDSVSGDHVDNLPIVLYQDTATTTEYTLWRSIWSSVGAKIIEMSPDEHDRLAARSQGVTHFIGRALERFGFTPTSIDTVGAQALYQLKNQVTNDTLDLFQDLQKYNPYTNTMRYQLLKSFHAVADVLAPHTNHTPPLIIGIQGGKGSFNEQAIQEYGHTLGIPYEIRYLYTADKVFTELEKGNIDIGQCAIHNSIGGMVGETVYAMAAHRCRVKKEFAIKITHALMIKKGVNFDTVHTVMAHDQVFRQCVGNMKKKYAYLLQEQGKGELQDTAKLAQELAEGRLPANTAILGPQTLADMYDFTVVEQNLQDLKENFTSFLWVENI